MKFIILANMKTLNLVLVVSIVFVMTSCKEGKSAESANIQKELDIDAVGPVEPAPDQVNGDNAIDAKFVEAGLGDLAYYTFKDKGGTEYTFDVNKSSLQFLLESADADAEQGWKTNEKLVGKNFRLIFKEEMQFNESAGMELKIKTIQSAQLMD